MRSLHPWSFFPSNLSPTAARSMALQFALGEIGACLKTIQQIEERAIGQILGERWPKELTILLKELDQIMLTSLSDPFGQRGGALDKLAYFASKMGTPAPDLSQLKACESILLESKEKFSAWRGRPFPEREKVLSELSMLCRSCKNMIERFFFSLHPSLEEARFDENVLFRLIELRSVINEALQAPVVEKMFAKLYPSGPAHLKAILHEGYHRRGFGDFFLKHEPLIDSVDWTFLETAPLLHSPE